MYLHLPYEKKRVYYFEILYLSFVLIFPLAHCFEINLSTLPLHSEFRTIIVIRGFFLIWVFHVKILCPLLSY